MSLRLRLLLALAPLFILGLAAADAGTYVATRSSLLQGVDKQLLVIEPGVQNVLQSTNQGGGPPDSGYGQQDAFPSGTYGELVNASGVTTEAGYASFGGTVAPSSSSHPVVPSDIANYAGSAITVPGEGLWESYRGLVSSQPARFPGDTQSTVVVAVPLDGVNTTLSTLLLFEIAISSGIT